MLGLITSNAIFIVIFLYFTECFYLYLMPRDNSSLKGEPLLSIFCF